LKYFRSTSESSFESTSEVLLKVLQLPVNSTSDSNFSLHESSDIALESFENSHRIRFIAARTFTPFDHAATNYNRRKCDGTVSS
jgi:hypothetical protein